MCATTCCMKIIPTIQGTRINLRPFSLDDVKDSYVGWFNDPEVCKYNGHGEVLYTLELGREYATRVRTSETDAVFAVIEKESGRHVGNISLQKIDLRNRSAEYAIIIGEKDVWGKGIAHESSELLIEYGFRELGLHRIYCGTSVLNIPMQKLAASLSFVQEGLLKDAMNKNGEFVDLVLYGLLNPSK